MRMSLSTVAALAALLAATPTVDAACAGWTGSTSLAGDTVGTTDLHYWNEKNNANYASSFGTSGVSMYWPSTITTTECTWDITCPTGSFVGFTNLDYSPGSSGFAFALLDVDDAANVVTLASLTGAGSNLRALYPTTNKLQIQYNGTGATNKGFSASYKCFTTTCPSDLVSTTTWGSVTKSGFELRDSPVPGTACTFTFACTDTSDNLHLSHRLVSNFVVTATIDSVGAAATYVVPWNATNSGIVITAATSYSITYAAQSSLSWTPSVGFVALWAGCQAATATSDCDNVIRNNAELGAAGEGEIKSDPDGDGGDITPWRVQDCEFHITCPSNATDLKFFGEGVGMQLRSVTGSGHFSTTSTGGSGHASGSTLQSIGFSNTSGYVALSSTQLTFPKAEGSVNWSCGFPECSTSPQSWWHGQTRPLVSTTLRKDTHIEITDETIDFTVTAASESWMDPQNCSFAVTCPAGFFVLLNVSGAVTKVDQLVITGDHGDRYNYDPPVDEPLVCSGFSCSGSNVGSGSTSIITTSRSVSWYQSSLHVTAGCTTYVRGTCPFEDDRNSSSYFSELATNASASVGFSTLVESLGVSHSGADWNAQGNLKDWPHPVGYKCSYPVQCPYGYHIKLMMMDDSLWNTNGTSSGPPYFKVPITLHYPIMTKADGTNIEYRLNGGPPYEAVPVHQRYQPPNSISANITDQWTFYSDNTAQAFHICEGSATMSWETRHNNLADTRSQTGFFMRMECSNSEVYCSATTPAPPTPPPVATTTGATATTGTTATSVPTPLLNSGVPAGSGTGGSASGSISGLANENSSSNSAVLGGGIDAGSNEGETDTVIVIVICIVIVIVAVGGGGGGYMACRGGFVIVAPLGDKPFTVVYCEIERGASLWNAHPGVMEKAVAHLHSELLHPQAKKNKCYEAVSEDRARCYVIVTEDPQAAVRCAADIQMALLQATWPAGTEETIDAFYAELDKERELTQENSGSGPRLRIAIHQDVGSMEKVEGGKVYSGLAVDGARDAVAYTSGGQIFMTQPVFDAVNPVEELRARIRPVLMDNGHNSPLTVSVADAEIPLHEFTSPELDTKKFPKPGVARRASTQILVCTTGNGKEADEDQKDGEEVSNPLAADGISLKPDNEGDETRIRPSEEEATSDVIMPRDEQQSESLQKTE